MSALKTKHKLLLAIGNNAREDDGLGWAFAKHLEQKGRFEGEVLYRYQLQIEDAELISNYDEIYFVDASKEQYPTGFEARTCEAQLDTSFSTHAVSPESILYLCEDLYDKKPKATLWLIEGVKWSLNIGMSEEAKINLQNALAEFEEAERASAVHSVG